MMIRGLFVALAVAIVRSPVGGESYDAHLSSDSSTILLKLKRDLRSYNGTDSSSVDCGPLGEFNTSGEWRYLVPDCNSSWTPWIDTSFQLHTRKTTNASVEIRNLRSGNFTSGFSRYFERSKNLTIVCHGFLQSVKSDWVTELKDVLLEIKDQNVLLVDWEKGAGGMNILAYKRCAGNTRAVGRILADLVFELTKKYEYDPIKIHFVGFSLGGQIAGFFADEFTSITQLRIGRLSVLDPAGPLFEETGLTRLSSSSAEYVDVIHTSAGDNIFDFSFGMTEAVGVVDFYPNGGRYQPWCIEPSCSHSMSTRFYVSSVKDCASYPYLSVSCPELVDPKEYKKCYEVNVKNMSNFGQMGYWSINTSATGPQYLTTQASSPYCSANFKLTKVPTDEKPQSKIRYQIIGVAIGSVSLAGVLVIMSVTVYYRKKRLSNRYERQYE